MRGWLAVEVALLLTLAPCGLVIVRARRLEDCMVALQMAGVITVLALLTLAEAMKRPGFYNLAIEAALLGLPAGLLFSHFLERWWK